ncbi:NADPH-dependent FMN reductase [Parasphingorhabdus halotolerans]|uniref:NAD(P)H-dependent oxidoreductase n=1 Tax=Parasphingorhabdus halotolerans TaxID=2725558 RepID=A0A6H2DLZ7_9SPHN|nr:NAD(P)H-dependent oxidoreductase [Parasphingorhabdus halotolerans]QJB69689.1 NAD(P)H-dependent oxidoreductase [Parasphingorhabdus halotolerans]
MAKKPFILGLGGTTNPESSTEQALAIALQSANEAGADTELFGSHRLMLLPHYRSDPAGLNDTGKDLVELVRRADGVLLSSPGYHGTVSGLVKNAIDYIEETSGDERVYLDGIPIGLIVTAHGWQAVGSTLAALRSIVHSLRGWPTPLGVGINALGGMFCDGVCSDDGVNEQLNLVAQQVMLRAETR